MSDRERLDIPNWVFTASEKIQAVGEKVPLSWLINPFAGSSSPNYVQAKWREVGEVIDASTDKPAMLPIALGDPNASPLAAISRLKRQVAVLGSPVDQVRSLIEDYDAEPAVAFTYRFKTRAGTLPRGVLEFSINADNFNYQAGIRLGRNDIGAGIGVWLPQENVFLRPRRAIVAEQNMPLDDFHDNHPGTPLV